MAKIIDIGTLYSKIHSSANKHLNSSNDPEASPPSRKSSFIAFFAPALLICTMLPAGAVTRYLCTVELILLLIISVFWFRNIAKSTWALIFLLTIASTISGCSPLLSKGLPTDFIKFSDADTKYHTIEKIGFLGYGLEDVTVSKAVEEAHFDSVQAFREERGYGLISVAKIVVAGKV